MSELARKFALSVLGKVNTKILNSRVESTIQSKIMEVLGGFEEVIVVWNRCLL